MPRRPVRSLLRLSLFGFLVCSVLACDPSPKRDSPDPSEGVQATQASGAKRPPRAAVERVANPPKLLLIGMDGADLRWVDRLAREGRLPSFKSLIERGVAGPLRTVHYASPIIWTSVATGVQPWRHGIGGFLAHVDAEGNRLSPEESDAPKRPDAVKKQNLPKTQVLPSGRERPASVAQRTRPAFWNILSHYQRSVGVLAWWATYPAERVNGYMVSPYLIFGVPPRPGTAKVDVEWTKEDAAKAFPVELGDELAPTMYDDSEIDRVRHAAILGAGPQTPNSTWVLARDRSYYEAVLHTMKTRPVECVAVYFQGPDVASHDFTYFTFGKNINEKRKPRVDDKAVAAGLRRVEAMYEYMDELLGGLLAAVGPDTDIIIVSDHGWEYDGTSHWNLNPGTFVAAGPSIQDGKRIDEVSVLDITPLVLSILDVPLARAFDGVIPEGVLQPELKSRIKYVDDYPIPAVSLAVERSDEAVAEEEKMMELLRSLGYIE